MNTLTHRQRERLVHVLAECSISWQDLAGSFNMSANNISTSLPIGSTPISHIRLIITRLCNRGESIAQFKSAMSSLHINAAICLGKIGYGYTPYFGLPTCARCHTNGNPLGACDFCRMYVCVECAIQELLPNAWVCSDACLSRKYDGIK